MSQAPSPEAARCPRRQLTPFRAAAQFKEVESLASLKKKADLARTTCGAEAQMPCHRPPRAPAPPAERLASTSTRRPPLIRPPPPFPPPGAGGAHPRLCRGAPGHAEELGAARAHRRGQEGLPEASLLLRLTPPHPRNPPPSLSFAAHVCAATEAAHTAAVSYLPTATRSKGVIQPNFDPVRIAKGYEAGGAACLSVLTDAKFFQARGHGLHPRLRRRPSPLPLSPPSATPGRHAPSAGPHPIFHPSQPNPYPTHPTHPQGGFENLTLIRKAGVKCPLLCKEFIVEPYQARAAPGYGSSLTDTAARAQPRAPRSSSRSSSSRDERASAGVRPRADAITRRRPFRLRRPQIYKARVAGADAILLIAAVLPNQARAPAHPQDTPDAPTPPPPRPVPATPLPHTPTDTPNGHPPGHPPQDLKYLMAIAKSLSLQCLIEVHTEAEMERVLRLPGVEMLGINNRDLGTFKVDLQLTCRLLETAPGRKAHADGVLVVGESGIFTKEDVAVMQGVGVGAILVGESIVKQDDPETGVKKLYGRA